jgi:hypothetical protein
MLQSEGIEGEPGYQCPNVNAEMKKVLGLAYYNITERLFSF